MRGAFVLDTLVRDIARVCLTLSLVLTAAAQQQAQQTKPGFMDYGVVLHNGDNTATVVANYPSPLEQAIAAVRVEYGWQVNYEGPPYFSNFDLVDNTGPKWRASHPLAKGATIPAGGPFTSTFPTNISEEDVLKKIISDYNSSGNPGKFELRKVEDNRYSVVGIAVKDESGNDLTVVPLLDTLLTGRSQELNANDAKNFFFSLLSSQTGKKVIDGSVMANIFFNSARRGVVGGENLPARSLLEQACALTGRPLVWDLIYNADAPAYVMDIEVAYQFGIDAFGYRVRVPLDSNQYPSSTPPTPKPQ